MELSEEERWEQEAELSISTDMDVRSAERLMRSADPVVQTITAPDPMALVRDQLAKLESEKAASTAPTESARGLLPGTAHIHSLITQHYLSIVYLGLVPVQEVAGQLEKPKQRRRCRRHRVVFLRLLWREKQRMRSRPWYVLALDFLLAIHAIL